LHFDVDCIPGRSLLGRYYEAGVDLEHRDALLCGPITYLPPRGAEGYPMALELIVPMRWVGAHMLFISSIPCRIPPIEHLHDIVRNAKVFRERCGRWRTG
jgi:hypothetical protein